MNEDKNAVSRPEFISLKESINRFIEASEENNKSFRRELSEQRKQSSEDAKQLHEAILTMGNDFHSALRDSERSSVRDRVERSKVPYALLTLIFSVIVAVFGVLRGHSVKNATDIKEGFAMAEKNSKERHFEQDIVLQREIRLLDKAHEKAQNMDHERLDLLDKRLRELEKEHASSSSQTELKIATDGIKEIKETLKELRRN